jgi:hypothetical protein
MVDRPDLAHLPLAKLMNEVKGRGLSGAEISKRAMRLLMRKQYAGKAVPDCKSLRSLMA